jgi:hypothetical protein
LFSGPNVFPPPAKIYTFVTGILPTESPAALTGMLISYIIKAHKILFGKEANTG